MLSKSTGQILRVAACFNVLFRIRDDKAEPWPESNQSDDIIDAAIAAACNFVDTCCIHTAFMAGWSTSLSKIQEMKTSDEKFFLTFAGNVLNISDIINARRFKNRGKKEEALTALTVLQNDGLGTLSDLPSSKHSAHTVSSMCNMALCIDNMCIIMLNNQSYIIPSVNFIITLDNIVLTK